MQYDINIKPSLYARYYYECRELFKNCEYEFPYDPLTRDEADRLEINSEFMSMKIIDDSEAEAECDPDNI